MQQNNHYEGKISDLEDRFAVSDQEKKIFLKKKK